MVAGGCQSCMVQLFFFALTLYKTEETEQMSKTGDFLVIYVPYFLFCDHGKTTDFV